MCTPPLGTARTVPPPDVCPQHGRPGRAWEHSRGYRPHVAFTDAHARPWVARRLCWPVCTRGVLPSCSTRPGSPLGQGPEFLGLGSQTSTWGAPRPSCRWSVVEVVGPINTGGLGYQHVPQAPGAAPGMQSGRCPLCLLIHSPHLAAGTVPHPTHSPLVPDTLALPVLLALP